MRDKRFFSDEWYADKYDYQNEDSILAYSKKLEGKTLRDVLSESEVKEIENDELDKGEFGKILERYYFGLELNSSPEPDFSDIGLELKVTPCKVNNKKQLISKERLVLNIINPFDIVKETWESSSFLKKNNRILLLRYICPMNPDDNGKVDYSVSKLDYKFINISIHVMKNSLFIKEIKKDWEYIFNKINEGRPDLLSEKYTSYMGPCPKGRDKKSKRNYPNFTEKYMQRAFALKTNYMNILLMDSDIISNWKK